MALTNGISDVFKKYYHNSNFSGAGLVKQGNSTIFSGAFGYAHKGMKVENTINTRFDTASITKLFTTVAVLQLIDKGLLSFNDRIIKMLNISDTSISEEVTIYHLLTHTSGIGDDADEEDGESYEEIWKNKPNYSIRETVDFLRQFIHKPSKFAPGMGCRYNNVAFVLLGLAMEKVSGIKYRDYIAENIFKKAGMSNTEFCSMDGIYSNVAEGYAKVDDDRGNLIGWRKNIYSFPPIGSPDSGAYTTVGDLDRFIRSLRRGELLSGQLTNEILCPKVVYRKHENFTEMMGYGFEFAVDSDDRVIFMKKDGCNPGVDCVITYYPDIDTTVAILANQDCNVWNINREIQVLLLET